MHAGIHPLGRHPPGWHPPWADSTQADTPPADGYCSGQYASYWNAFLFLEVDYFPGTLSWVLLGLFILALPCVNYFVTHSHTLNCQSFYSSSWLAVLPAASATRYLMVYSHLHGLQGMNYCVSFSVHTITTNEYITHYNFECDHLVQYNPLVSE